MTEFAPGEFGESVYGSSFFMELPELLSPSTHAGDKFWKEMQQKAEREGITLGFGVLSGRMRRPHNEKNWDLTNRKVILLSGGDSAHDFFSMLRYAMHKEVRLLRR